MGLGCPHCRVIGGPHDDWCPWHPARAAAAEELEEAQQLAADELDAMNQTNQELRKLSDEALKLADELRTYIGWEPPIEDLRRVDARLGELRVWLQTI